MIERGGARPAGPAPSACSGRNLFVLNFSRWNVERRTSNIERRTSNPTSNVEHRTSNVERRTLGTDGAVPHPYRGLPRIFQSRFLQDRAQSRLHSATKCLTSRNFPPQHRCPS